MTIIRVNIESLLKAGYVANIIPSNIFITWNVQLLILFYKWENEIVGLK